MDYRRASNEQMLEIREEEGPVRLLIFAKHYLPYYSALSVRLFNIAKRLCQKNSDISIRIVVLELEDAKFCQRDGSSERIEVRRYSRGPVPGSLLVPHSLNPVLLGWWALIAAKEMKEFKPDIVMATTPPFVPVTAFYLAYRILGKGLPYIIDYRDDLTSYIDNVADKGMFYLKYPLKASNRLMSSLLFRAVKDAFLVSAVNDTLLKEIQKINPNAILMPNGIDVEEIANVAEGFNRDAVLTKNGIKDRDSKVIAYVGDLNWPYYMPEIILEPIRRLKERGFKISYVVVGDGSRMEVLERMSKENGLEDSVYLLGRMKHRDAIEMLMASDAAFYTLQKGDVQSNHAISTKIYEYIGCKLPILAVSDRGSAISELLKAKGVGIPLGWDELEKMEFSLRELLESHAYRENLEANYLYCLDRFDRNNGINLLYEKLMDEVERIRT